MASKVLVLGAGASSPYGYPLGSELRQQILTINTAQAKEAGIIDDENGDEAKELEAFTSAFRYSSMYSIDAFLARRREFAGIGKKCIAAKLLQCESKKALFRESPDKDHWYQYLLSQIAVHDWDDLDLSDLAVVSFNYDRSLEHFLLESLQNAYGRSQEDVRKRLQDFKVLHVYGSLGAIYPGDENYQAYDGATSAEKVALAADSLVVIPEGRMESASLITARSWLTGAKKIGFLGFGFDPTNVERLAQGGACKRIIQDRGARRTRFVSGTRKGLTDAEVEHAFQTLAQDGMASASSLFFDCNCVSLLRSTLFLH